MSKTTICLEDLILTTRRFWSGLLCLAVLLSLTTQPALATTGSQSSDVLPSDVVTAGDVAGSEVDVTSLNTSEAGIALIKELEGFSAEAYWDYSQYSIGYGTVCDVEEYPDGITEAEADLLLREVLAVYESSLDAFLEQYNITLSQQQYDALMSFTYNNGASWMSQDCKLTQCLLRGVNNCSAEEIMNAFGPWCHINSGPILTTLALRRIVEVQVFLYGVYTNSATSFYYVIFDANGGTLSGSQEDILYFQYGTSLDTLDLFYLEVEQTAEMEGAVFCGWRTAAHRELTDRSAVTTNMTVYAMWDENTATSVLPAASELEGFSTGFQDQIQIPESTIDASQSETPAATEPDSSTSAQPTEETQLPGSDTQLTPSAVSFTDVSESDWYYNAVTYVVVNDLFHGVSATSFSPETPMTRAMFVTVLANYTGVSLSSYGVPNFSDVSESDWFCSAVSWATQCGIVTGYNNGSFGPNDPITREQMCVILNRYVQFMGGVLPQTQEAATFTDQSSISSYALESVSACQQAGIISGRTDGSFDPQGTALRCEVAQVMMAFSQLFA